MTKRSFDLMKQHLAEMVGGPGYFRFFLQPIVAIVLGVRHGLRDWRIGHPIYLFGLIRVREARWQRIREGTRSVALPLIVALAGAYTFQYVILSRILVGYGLLYATVFVLIPYLAARGVGHRLARRVSRSSRKRVRVSGAELYALLSLTWQHGLMALWCSGVGDARVGSRVCSVAQVARGGVNDWEELRQVQDNFVMKRPPRAAKDQ
jgi:hypothetical protein